jgi:hypothetical protein
VKKLLVVTDSQAAKAIVERMHSKQERELPLPPVHALPGIDLAVSQALYDCIGTLMSRGIELDWLWVKAHTQNMDEHSIGNRIADDLATKALEQARLSPLGVSKGILQAVANNGMDVVFALETVDEEHPLGRRAMHEAIILNAVQQTAMNMAHAARSARVRAGTAWTRWQLPVNWNTSRSKEYLNPLYQPLRTPQQWSNINVARMQLPPHPSEWRADTWRAIAKGLGNAALFYPSLFGYAYRVLTGTWQTPDYQNHFYHFYGTNKNEEPILDWYCPFCADEELGYRLHKPDTPHLISCGLGGSGRWYHAIVPGKWNDEATGSDSSGEEEDGDPDPANRARPPLALMAAQRQFRKVMRAVRDCQVHVEGGRFGNAAMERMVTYVDESRAGAAQQGQDPSQQSQCETFTTS